MMKSHQAVCCCALAVLLGTAESSSGAAVLEVDFGTEDTSQIDTGASPNRVQPGFEDFSYGPEFNFLIYDQAVKVPPPTLTRTFGTIDVTVFDPTPATNGLFFTDEGTVAGVVGPLADDFLSFSSGDLQVALSGLPAGPYSMTTYHHRPLGTVVNTFTGITVDTGIGPQAVATDVPVSIGLSPSSVSSATFQFTTDGTNDVVVVIQGGPGSFALNGFSVVEIPEPSSAILLAIGAGLIWVTSRRKRKRSRGTRGREKSARNQTESGS
jgi:hypothetical protein